MVSGVRGKGFLCVYTYTYAYAYIYIYIYICMGPMAMMGLMVYLCIYEVIDI